MIDSKLEHVANEYYIKLSNNKERNICVVTMPENIFLEYPEVTSIYELDSDKITIYRNKEKFLSKSCPDYAKRTVMWSHMLRLMEDRNLLNAPVVIEDIEQKIVECDSIESAITKLLVEPDSSNDVELEVKLIDTIAEIARGNKGQVVPEDILEGVNICLEVFRGD